MDTKDGDRLSDEAVRAINKYLRSRLITGAGAFGIVNIAALWGAYNFVVDKAANAAIESTKSCLEQVDRQLVTLTNHATGSLASALIEVGEAKNQLGVIDQEMKRYRGQIDGLNKLDLNKVKEISGILNTSRKELNALIAAESSLKQIEVSRREILIFN